MEFFCQKFLREVGFEPWFSLKNLIGSSHMVVTEDFSKTTKEKNFFGILFYLQTGPVVVAQR